jgi:hypothetical protein
MSSIEAIEDRVARLLTFDDANLYETPQRLPRPLLGFLSQLSDPASGKALRGAREHVKELSVEGVGDDSVRTREIHATTIVVIRLL